MPEVVHWLTAAGVGQPPSFELPSTGAGPMSNDPRESADGAAPPIADPVKLEPKLLMSEIVDIVDPEVRSSGVKFLPNATSSGCPVGNRTPGLGFRYACACWF